MLQKSIIIGVSAHRNIRKDSAPRIEEQVRRVISDLRAAFPQDPLVMLNGLAYGGDLLCGRIAADMGVKLAIALPFAESEYVNTDDFPFGSDKEYKKLRKDKCIAECFVVPDIECADRIGSDRDYCFRQQSIYVATQCDVLLALWDGTDASDSYTECGTNAAVGFALKHNYRHSESSQYPPKCVAVAKIFSPREGRKYENDCDIQLQYLTPNLFDDGKYYSQSYEIPLQLTDSIRS